MKLNIGHLVKKLKKVSPTYWYVAGAVVVLLGVGTSVLLARNTSSKVSDTDTTDQSTGKKTQDAAKGNTKTESSPAATQNNPTQVMPTGPAPAGDPKAPAKSSQKPSTGGSAPIVAADTQAPSAPTGFVVRNSPDNSQHRILDWDASSDNVDVKGYYLYRKTDSYDNYLRQAPFHNVDDGSTDDTDIYPLCSIMTIYSYYAVQAYDAAGNKSSLAEATILDEPWVNCHSIGI